MDVEQLIENMRQRYPNYTISISEQEDYHSVAIRVSADNSSVSIIKGDCYSLEDVMEDTIERLECLLYGKEYGKDCKNSFENESKVLKLALQELSFDKAVSLLEKFNR
jgi:hypothetical protein